MKNKKILKLSFISLFSAIICFGSFLRFPLGPIPIVFQNVLCLLSAAIFGGFLGFLPTVLFLFAGFIGLPVFSGGTSGLTSFLGPTGGFLFGYLFGALITSLISKKPSVEEKKISWKIFFRISSAIIIGMIFLYIPGIIHFSFWAEKAGKISNETSSIKFAISSCVTPFIPGDILKIIIAIPIALKIRPILALYLNGK